MLKVSLRLLSPLQMLLFTSSFASSSSSLSGSVCSLSHFEVRIYVRRFSYITTTNVRSYVGVGWLRFTLY